MVSLSSHLFLLILLTSWKINGLSLSTANAKANGKLKEKDSLEIHHHENEAKQLALATAFLKLVKAVQHDDYHNSSLELSPSFRTQAGQNRRKPHQTNSFSTNVRTKVPGSNKHITPDNVEVTCTTKNCGKCITLTPKRGKIQSPNYPRGYGNNLDCIYTIEVTSPGYAIDLRFTTFVVEQNHDFVTVQSGKQRKKTLTGYSRSAPVTTQSRKVIVNFKTDKDNKELNAAKTNGGKWEAIYTIKKLPERSNSKTWTRTSTSSTTPKSRFPVTSAKNVIFPKVPTTKTISMAKKGRAISEETLTPTIMFSDTTTIKITTMSKEASTSTEISSHAGYLSTESLSVLQEPETSTEESTTTIPTDGDLFTTEVVSATEEPKHIDAKKVLPKYPAKTPIIAYPYRHGISNPKKLEWFVLENFRAF